VELSKNPAESPRCLDLSFLSLRNRLCIAFCGDKSPKLVALAPQVTTPNLCHVQIGLLDAYQFGEVFVIAALFSIKWPGWKWVAGFSELVAKRDADAMRAVQQPCARPLPVTEKTQIGADTTIRLQRIEVQINPAFLASRANKKRLHAERHLSPCHGDDLRHARYVFPYLGL